MTDMFEGTHYLTCIGMQYRNIELVQKFDAYLIAVVEGQKEFKDNIRVLFEVDNQHDPNAIAVVWDRKGKYKCDFNSVTDLTPEEVVGYVGRDKQDFFYEAARKGYNSVNFEGIVARKKAGDLLNWIEFEVSIERR